MGDGMSRGITSRMIFVPSGAQLPDNAAKPSLK